MNNALKMINILDSSDEKGIKIDQEITKLNKKVQFKKFKLQIKQMTDKEVFHFAKDKTQLAQLRNSVTHLNELSFLNQNLTLDALIFLYQEINLLKLGLNSIERCCFLLQSLSTEKFSVVLLKLKPVILEITIKTDDFSFILNQIDKDKVKIFVEIFESELLSFIENAYDLEIFLASIETEKRQYLSPIYLTISKVKQLIKTASDFRSVFAYLSEDQRNTLFEIWLNSNYFKDLIQSSTDIHKLFHYLSDQQKKLIYKKDKAIIIDKVHSIKDIGFLFMALPLELKSNLINTLNEKQFKSHCLVYDLNKLLIFLEAQNYAIIFGKNKLIENITINKIDDLLILMYGLSKDQTNALLKYIIFDFSLMIRCIDDVNYLFRRLSFGQIGILAEVILKHLFAQKLIQTGSDYAEILNYLSEDKKAIIFELSQKKLTKLIKTGEDFGLILEVLEQQQRQYLYQKFRYKFLTIIHCAYDFGWVLASLDEKQKEKVYRDCEGRLSVMIKSVIDLREILKFLPPFLCQKLASNINLLDVIENKDNLSFILEGLSFEQAISFCHSLIQWPKLKLIIQSVDDISFILKTLTSMQAKAACDVFKSWILKENFIKSATDFGLLFQFLNASLLEVVYFSFKELFEQIVVTPIDFRCVLAYLDLEKTEKIIELTQRKLKLFKQCEENIDLLTYGLSLSKKKIIDCMT